MRGTYAFQPMAHSVIAASLFQQWKVTAAVDEPVTAAFCADQFMHICGHGGYLRMYAAQIVKLGIEKVTVRCGCYMGNIHTCQNFGQCGEHISEPERPFAQNLAATMHYDRNVANAIGLGAGYRRDIHVWSVWYV